METPIQVSPKTLQNMIALSVDRAMSRIIRQYFNQSTIIKYITKAQAAEMLNYKTTHSLKTIEKNGMKIGGTYHELKPNSKGMYSYVDVARLRELKHQYNGKSKG